MSVGVAPGGRQLLARLPRPSWLPGAREIVVVVAGAGVVGMASRSGGRQPGLLIAVLIAGALVYVGSRRPAVSVVVGLASVALTPVLPAILYTVHVPPGIDRQFGALKDAAVACVVVAVMGRRRRRGPIDSVEVTACAFLLLLTVYAVFPLASNGFPVPDRSLRDLAWRLAGEWVVLMLALRRTEFREDELALVRGALLVVGSAVGLLCVYQYLDETAWNHFVVTTIKVPEYEAVVLKTSVSSTDLLSHNAFAGLDTVRVGGFGLNPLTTAALLLVPLSVATARLAAKPSAWVVVAFGLSFLGIGLTLTRSALIGAVVVLFAVFLGRRPHFSGRLTAGLGIGAVALATLPVLAASKLFDRFGASVNGQDSSATAHSADVNAALAAVPHQLLGEGLGTGPGIGAAHGVTLITAENAYLQIALETGLAGALTFTVMLIFVGRDGWQRAREASAGAVDAAAALAAVAALMTMSLFLDPWVDYSTVFALGLITGLPRSRSNRHQDEAA